MKSKPTIIVQLVHIEGPYKGQIQEFTDETIEIGRHPSCQLQFPVDHAIISRKHGKIVREGNRFKFVDHSTNGTFVNGKKVREVVLKDGDVLIFAKGGPKVSFLTQVTDTPMEAKPESPLEKVPPRADSAQPRKKRQVQKAMMEDTAGGKEPKQSPKPPPAASSQPQGEISAQKVQMPLAIVFGPTLRSYKELPVTIGKSSDCDFIMEHPQVFDHHAKVFYFDDKYFIKDLTGKRLVSVNGKPATPQVHLAPDSKLSLTPKGPEFRFLGQGRLLEIEKEQTQEHEPPPAEQNQEPPEPEKGKKGSFSIKKLWRK